MQYPRTVIKSKHNPDHKLEKPPKKIAIGFFTYFLVNYNFLPHRKKCNHNLAFNPRIDEITYFSFFLFCPIPIHMYMLLAAIICILFTGFYRLLISLPFVAMKTKFKLDLYYLLGFLPLCWMDGLLFLGDDQQISARVFSDFKLG
jgi:hypothetical protein